MLKRMLLLAAVALVLAVPAALAENGQPPAGNTPTARASGGHGDRAQKLQQRLDQMRDRLQKAAALFAKHCTGGAGGKDAARCTTAAKRMLDRLQKIDGRIGTFVGKIEQRCGGGTTTQAVPKACGRAEQIAARLQDVQSKIKQLEQKLQDWLSGHASSGGSTTTDSSAAPADDSGLESIDGLAADLAAVQSAAGN